MNDFISGLVATFAVGATVMLGLSGCAKDASISRSAGTAEFALARSSGCLACHSADGRPAMGPTWQGLLGRPRVLVDGSTVVADEAYIRRSIVDPAAQVLAGSTTVMPKVEYTEDQVSALVAYIASL